MFKRFQGLLCSGAAITLMFIANIGSALIVGLLFMNRICQKLAEFAEVDREYYLA